MRFQIFVGCLFVGIEKAAEWITTERLPSFRLPFGENAGLYQFFESRP